MANDTELTGLIVKIKADLTDYQTKLDQMQGQTAKASDSVANKFNDIGSAMAKVGLAIGTFAATSVMASVDWGKAVDDLSDKTGMAGEDSSKLLVIAKKVGISTELANSLFAKFAKSVYGAADAMASATANGKKSDDVLTRLGVSALNADGSMRSTLDIFLDVKKSLNGMGDGWQKTAFEMQLFGKAGFEIHDMLQMSNADYQAAIDKATSLGQILSTEAAAGAEQFERKLNVVKGTLSSVGITIGNELMPAIKEVLDGINGTTKAFVSMNPEVRSTIIEIIKLSGEMGIAVTILNRSLAAIGGVTEALGLMKAATLLAAGPWVTLAAAIAYAIYKLNEYQTKDRDWRGKQAVLDDPFAPQDAKNKAADTMDKTPGDPPPGSVYGPELPPGYTPPPINTDPFIGGDPNAGSSKTKEKTDLQKYLEQLKDVEDILNRQVDLGEINKEQVVTTLQAQLEGLKQVTVGQDETLDKDRAIYDLKSRLRQEEHDQIDIAKAKSDRDFAAQAITETQYFEQRKKQIQDEINLDAEGSAKRYSDEKALQDLINSNNEKRLNRTLSQINTDQEYASANLKIEAEQVRHKQAMDKIGDWQGDTSGKLQTAMESEKAIVDAQYKIDYDSYQKRIDALKASGEEKTDEIKKELDQQKLLTQKHNADLLALDDNLAEQQKQLEQNKIDANNATIAALISGTKSGHDVMLQQWTDFVNKVVAKMFAIKTETNIFESVLGPLFGLNTGVKLSGSRPDGVQGPTDSTGGFFKNVFSAAGGFDVPNIPGDIPTVLHRREMVLPEHLADKVRNGSGSGKDIQVNVINNTGVETTPQVSQSFDVDTHILTVVLDGVKRNRMGMRDVMRGGRS